MAYEICAKNVRNGDLTISFVAHLLYTIMRSCRWMLVPIRCVVDLIAITRAAMVYTNLRSLYMLCWVGIQPHSSLRRDGVYAIWGTRSTEPSGKL